MEWMVFKVGVGVVEFGLYREGQMSVQWLYRMYSLGCGVLDLLGLFKKNGAWAWDVFRYSRYEIVQFLMNLKPYIRAPRERCTVCTGCTDICHAHACVASACTPIKESCTDRKMMLKSTLFNPLSPDLCYKPP